MLYSASFVFFVGWDLGGRWGGYLGRWGLQQHSKDWVLNTTFCCLCVLLVHKLADDNSVSALTASPVLASRSIVSVTIYRDPVSPVA